MFSFCLKSDSECWSIESQKRLNNKAEFQYDENIAEIIGFL